MAALCGAYTTQIHASAVLEGEKQGLLTVISLNVTPGNGTVKFGGPTQINATTLSSAEAAVQCARRICRQLDALQLHLHHSERDRRRLGP